MSPTLFPHISRPYIESFQFSSWYTTFRSVSPKATVIRPLSSEFRAYLEEDGVIVPEGSEDCVSVSVESTSDDSDTEDAHAKRYAFPELDTKIREAIARYDAVFPKLNWSSPKDSSWVVPTLKCTSPADVYLLIKSSDFILHDLNPSLAFEGCSPPIEDRASQALVEPDPTPGHDLELILKKWYSIDPSREFRCFVRDEILLAVTQRDPNYYPHLNEQATKDKIFQSVCNFWAQSVKSKFSGGGDYVFDIHLTRDLSSAHILDFNPYHSKTDPLLFTYDELLQLLVSASSFVTADPGSSFVPGQSFVPTFRTITSPSHPAASRNAPANQHNALPIEVLQMSAGNDIATFSKLWEEKLRENLDET